MVTNFNVKQFIRNLADGAHLIRRGGTFVPMLNPAQSTISAKTANYTVTQADLDAPTIFTNAAAAGNVNFTLPTASTCAGKTITIHALAAQTTRLVPQATDAVNYGGSAVVNKYAQLAGVIGNFITVVSDGTNWIVVNGNGVVTKES
jgi:hypothetical protein